MNTTDYIKQSWFIKIVTVFVYIMTLVVGIGGMVYSYMAIVNYAATVAYGDTTLAYVYPLFTEGLMITLGLMVLAIKHRGWRNLGRFRFGTYTSALIVILFNMFHVNIIQNWNKWSGGWEIVVIVLLPVLTYLIFIEVAQYVIGETLQESAESKIDMSVLQEEKTPYPQEEVIDRWGPHPPVEEPDELPDMSTKEIKYRQSPYPEETVIQPEVYASTKKPKADMTKQKFINKSALVQSLQKGDFTQDSLAEVLDVNRQTVVNYYKELMGEGVLQKVGRGLYKVIKTDSEYSKINVDVVLEKLGLIKSDY